MVTSTSQLIFRIVFASRLRLPLIFLAKMCVFSWAGPSLNFSSFLALLVIWALSLGLKPDQMKSSQSSLRFSLFQVFLFSLYFFGMTWIQFTSSQGNAARTAFRPAVFEKAFFFTVNLNWSLASEPGSLSSSLSPFRAQFFFKPENLFCSSLSSFHSNFWRFFQKRGKKFFIKKWRKKFSQKKF